MPGVAGQYPPIVLVQGEFDRRGDGSATTQRIKDYVYDRAHWEPQQRA
jgi:hypothetical protein